MKLTRSNRLVASVTSVGWTSCPLTHRRRRLERLTPHALAVTRHLLTHGPASRGHLGRNLALSDASMSRAAQTLVRDGLVSETLDPRSSIGRPRQILAAVPDGATRRRREADRRQGLRRRVRPVRRRAGLGRAAPARTGRPRGGARRGHACASWRGWSRGSPSGCPPWTASASPWAAWSTTGPSYGRAASSGWRDVDLAGPLQEATGAPVVVTNDVTALAREQLWFGAGRTHSTFGLVTVGAGLGFGARPRGPRGRAADRQRAPARPRARRRRRTALQPRPPRVRRPPTSTATRSRPGWPRRGVTGSFAELIRDPAYADSPWLTEAARALGHLVATFAGALQTDRIVLAGEDVEPLLRLPRRWPTRSPTAPGSGRRRPSPASSTSRPRR